jgi:hypothetical protein
MEPVRDPAKSMLASPRQATAILLESVPDENARALVKLIARQAAAEFVRRLERAGREDT